MRTTTCIMIVLAGLLFALPLLALAMVGRWQPVDQLMLKLVTDNGTVNKV
jgi:ABC-type uncharacterized transport system YnjBCD permease subunit